jgi:hypothetical protein
MNYRIKEPKQVVLHAQGGSGAGFIDGVWHELKPQRRELTCVCGAVLEGETMVHPPPKQWIGLTEIEICDIEADELTSANSETFSFARAIEAKLKEKNT